MARKIERIPFKQQLSALKSGEPGRLYLLWGQEDYLRESYMTELKRLCLPDGGDDFSYRRIDGPTVDLRALAESVSALPFMTERTLTEVRGFDINKCRDADADELEGIVSDLPDWATLVFVMGTDYAVDWRLRAAKAIKKHGLAVEFTEQDSVALLPWIRKRFAALGKTIDSETSDYLVQTSGSLMNELIPEISKLAASARGDTITLSDVDKYAHHLPEARVFEMTDRMAARDWDGAARLMAELIASGEDPIKTNSIIAGQLQRLYAARVALDEGLGQAYVIKMFDIRFDSIARKLIQSAGSFTLGQLARAVELCAETDYAMKSAAEDDAALLSLLLCRLAAEAFA